MSKPFPLKWYSVVNLMAAVALIADGIFWIAKIYYPYTPGLLYQMFTGPGANATETQLESQMVGFYFYQNWYILILPVSILLLGLLLLGLDRTNPKIAIPLWLMACGAFDVFGDVNLIGRLTTQGNFWPVFQLCLMGGGWALAGFPKFKPNKWLALLIAVFVLTVGSGDGRPFELALFWYVITSTQPNLWGKTK